MRACRRAWKRSPTSAPRRFSAPGWRRPEPARDRPPRRVAAVIPAVEGLELAVRYLPASGDIGFSGDWYDVVSLHTRCIAVIVGDIAGHGIEARPRWPRFEG